MAVVRRCRLRVDSSDGLPVWPTLLFRQGQRIRIAVQRTLYRVTAPIELAGQQSPLANFKNMRLNDGRQAIRRWRGRRWQRPHVTSLTSMLDGRRPAVCRRLTIPAERTVARHGSSERRYCGGKPALPKTSACHTPEGARQIPVHCLSGNSKLVMQAIIALQMDMLLKLEAKLLSRSRTRGQAPVCRPSSNGSLQAVCR